MKGVRSGLHDNWHSEQGVKYVRTYKKVNWPTKSRLLQYVESASGLLENKPIETELDNEESKAEDFTNRISIIALLEKCNKDWSNILKELKGNAKVTEESEYTSVADREDGFIEVLLVATEVLERLKARITIISRKREQVALQATRAVIQENLSPRPPCFNLQLICLLVIFSHRCIFLSYSYRISMVIF